MDTSAASDSDKFLLDSDSTAELFDTEDEEMQMCLVAATAAANSSHIFSSNELLSDAQQSVDKAVGVRDVLATMKTTSSLLRTLLKNSKLFSIKLLRRLKPTRVQP